MTIRELAGDPVHERGLMLTRTEWGAVIYLPSLCTDFGEPCPEWAAALCQHALAVETMTPEPLLVALLHSMRHGGVAPCGLGVALRGVALDLCMVLPTMGDTAEILPTAFGYAVALVHRIRRLDEEHGAGEPAGEPS